MTETHPFPKDFLWGVATASYQIEGGAREDGRGESIWDVFSHTPGKVKNGDTGDVADDHYHLWRQDVALMKSLGVKAYRFSVAWPRIFPTGTGQLNEAGLAFYDNLVDELLKAGIQPLITLYHWDLPAALPGGWLERGTAHAFAAYTDVVTRCLGDRVKYWVTLNEPFCSAFLGYGYGWHAPGETNREHALRAAHHLHLAHGLGVQAIRANVKAASVGIVGDPTLIYPHSKSAADQKACRFYDGMMNRWFLDPVFGKGYPQDMCEDFARMGIRSESPDYIQPGDMETIAAPMDMLGVNYYTRSVIGALPGISRHPDRIRHYKPRGKEYTTVNWEVFPQGIFELLQQLNERYHPKSLFIAENGAAYDYGPDETGRVHDTKRVEYMRSHIAQISRAIRAGLPVNAYFAWSLMDNFEWAHGYSQRFGIVHVDYETRVRTVKDSGLFYKEVIEKNAVEGD
jgi:beta-glucosidase